MIALRRDKYQCQACGKFCDDSPDADEADRPHVDHIVELAKGGEHRLDNLRTLCASCHSKRTRAAIGS